MTFLVKKETSIEHTSSCLNDFAISYVATFWKSEPDGGVFELITLCFGDVYRQMAQNSSNGTGNILHTSTHGQIGSGVRVYGAVF